MEVAGLLKREALRFPHRYTARGVLRQAKFSASCHQVAFQISFSRGADLLVSGLLFIIELEVLLLSSRTIFLAPEERI
jgi:hypothetical protein